MAEVRATAKARVRVLLEIDLPDSWGGKCDLDQVWNQAKAGATEALRRGLYLGDGLTAAGHPPPTAAAKILEMTPLAVVVEDRHA